MTVNLQLGAMEHAGETGDRRMQPAGAGGGSGGGGMEPGFGKRLMHVLRAVYHMLRRGLCRKRLMMDLHLLLGRGKLAGRALRDVLLAHQAHAAAVAAARHHNHQHGGGGGGAMDVSSPASSRFHHHNPRDDEFSCTTTPSPYTPAGALFPFKIRSGGRGGRAGNNHDGLDAAAVALAFDLLNAEAGGETPTPAPGATPSPMLALSLGRSPAGVRQLRVTDSPFPVSPEGVDGRVDDKAGDFIEWFRQQLRQQQSVATPTPNNNCSSRRG